MSDEIEEMHDRITAIAKVLREQFQCDSVAIVCTVRTDDGYQLRSVREGNPYATRQSLKDYAKHLDEQGAFE